MGPEPEPTTPETRAYFEDRAHVWDSMMPGDLDDALQRLLAPFGSRLQHAKRILEVGTGTGMLIPHLAQFVPPARLVSVDLAHAMLTHAHDRCPAARLVQCDVHLLPFSGPPEDGFDVLVCHNSFPHYANKPRALAEFRRVLNAGGIALILHNLPRERVNGIHARVGRPLADHVLPAPDAMRRLLAQAGFRQIAVEDAVDRYIAQGIKD